MKAILVVAVLLGLAYYFYTHREQPAPPPEKKPELAVAPVVPTATPQNFDKLTGLLTQDMQGVPALLDGPAHPPTNAVAIRRGLGSHEAAWPEYQTLAKACDLIVQAEAQRESLQQACHTEQTRSSFGSALTGNASMDHAVSTKNQSKIDPAKTRAATQQEIYQKYESSWGSYRTQTAGQVQALLGSLAGKQL